MLLKISWACNTKHGHANTISIGSNGIDENGGCGPALVSAVRRPPPPPAAAHSWGSQGFCPPPHSDGVVSKISVILGY